MRKKVPWLSGRWWWEDPGLQKSSVITPPVETSMIDGVFGRTKGSKEQLLLRSRVEDQGVCKGCRREDEVLFWGCVTCFRNVLDEIRHLEISGRNPVERVFFRVQSRCVRYIDWWERHRIIEFVMGLWDSVSCTREFVTGKFRHPRRKKLHDAEFCGGDHDEGRMTGPWFSHRPVRRYWESRCASC